MEQSFPVTVCGKHAGKVWVQRKGLYYLFSCRCNISGNIMYRLMVTCGRMQENLGILIPQEHGFGLEKTLAVRRIGEGDMSFTLVPKHEVSSGTFVPISPEEPFAYISRLKESFLAHREGQVGICIAKKQE